MPSNRVYVVKNSKGVVCSTCTGVHEFLTITSKDTTCDAPAAFSLEVAQNMSRLHANSHEDVLVAPDDTLVVMHPSARKLPVMGLPELGFYTTVERMA